MNSNLNFKNRRNTKGLLLLVFLTLNLVFVSCKNQLAKSIPADEPFDVFFDRFHADSIFQMSRIQFPLPGVNTDHMQMEDTVYHWTESNWELHHDFNLDTTDFIVEKNILDSLVVEKIYLENSGFIVERTFKKLEGLWFLVYFKNINL